MLVLPHQCDEVFGDQRQLPARHSDMLHQLARTALAQRWHLGGVDWPEPMPCCQLVEHARKERKRIGQRAVEVKNDEAVVHRLPASHLWPGHARMYDGQHHRRYCGLILRCRRVSSAGDRAQFASLPVATIWRGHSWGKACPVTVSLRCSANADSHRSSGRSFWAR